MKAPLEQFFIILDEIDNFREYGLKINVLGGTSKSDEDLCASCKHYKFVRDAKTNRTFRDCNWVDFKPSRMPEVVAECSSYMNKSATTLEEMKQIAWEIKGDPKAPIGFKFEPPAKDKTVWDNAKRFQDVNQPEDD